MEKFNTKEEERASGIQREDVDEIYTGLTDIKQRMEEARKSWKMTTEKEQGEKKHWI